MDVRVLLEAPPDTLVPVGWVREHLLSEPDPMLVRYRLALQVASTYWAGVIRGELPPPLARAGRIPHGDRNDHPEAHVPMPKSWREKFGTKGISRVTLFTRPKVSPYIYIEWWGRDGRRIARRLECDGVPVDDVGVARSIARETVERLEDKVKQEFWMQMASKPNLVPESVRRMLGAPASPGNNGAIQGGGAGTEAAVRMMKSDTVENVFDEWLDDQEADIKLKTTSARQWKEALGPTTILSSLTPANVGKTVKDTAKKHGWAAKTRFNKVQHLRMALIYARDFMELNGPDPMKLNCSKPALADTQELTYNDQEYERLLSVALQIADPRLALVPQTSFDGSNITPSQALLVAGALSICGTVGRRIEQTRTMTPSGVKPVTLLKGVLGFEFRFPRIGEKTARFQDAQYTIATLNARQHPLQYLAVDLLLATPGVQTSKLLFPSVPNGKSIMDRLSPTSVGQKTLREYLKKLERASGVESIEDRAFHGLKRLAATRCKTMEELTTLSLISNTSMETLKDYHKRLGTFTNEATRLAQEEALRKSMEVDDGETG